MERAGKLLPDLERGGLVRGQAVCRSPPQLAESPCNSARRQGGPGFWIWENGAFSKGLKDDSSAYENGAGFDAKGNFYVFYGSNGLPPVLARWPNVNKSWDKFKLDPPQGLLLELAATAPQRRHGYSAAHWASQR